MPTQQDKESGLSDHGGAQRNGPAINAAVLTLLAAGLLFVIKKPTGQRCRDAKGRECKDAAGADIGQYQNPVIDSEHVGTGNHHEPQNVNGPRKQTKFQGFFQRNLAAIIGIGNLIVLGVYTLLTGYIATETKQAADTQQKAFIRAEDLIKPQLFVEIDD